MAKFLIAVLATLLLINTMTFLVVVNQEPETETVKEEKPTNNPVSAAVTRQAAQLKSITQSMNDLKRSVQSLTSRVSQLDSKVTVALRRPPPAPAPSRTKAAGGEEEPAEEEEEPAEEEEEPAEEEESAAGENGQEGQ